MNIKDIGLLEELDKIAVFGYASEQDLYPLSFSAVTRLENSEQTQIIASFINATNRTFKPFNDNNLQLSISSDSTSDTIDITLHCINQLRDKVIFNITLNGTTPVNLPNDIYCIYRLENNTDTDQVGNISITDTNGLFYQNMILTGGEPSNNSLSSISSIPRGYVGLITRIIVSPQNAVDFKGGLFIRNKNGVFKYRKNLTAYETPIALKDLEVFCEEESDIVFQGNSKLGGLVYVTYDMLIIRKELIGKYKI